MNTNNFRSIVGLSAVIILIVTCTMFFGCAHYVIVQDQNHDPIANATVVVQSLSIDWKQGETDSNGKCRIDRWYAQSPVWLSITKPGYVWCYDKYPNNWPYTAVLMDAPAGYENEVYRPSMHEMNEINIPNQRVDLTR